MGLCGSNTGALSDEDSAIGLALVDVATISLLHEQALRESTLVNDQLQRALNSRVLIEQAKAVIAQMNGVDMNEAFARLARYARPDHLNLREPSGKIVEGSLAL
ncbi:ANTAR domain-containing protein [Arthrobacter sp. 260]|uniref:ANTAR domain-containing protein n=1 Tax=Arthrobacter sp. 260 TaxID=2735314 RepID=UPI0014908CA0|nr:ANTAR domain-containing protein [Arthrobacter sp. 260]NOJ61180.1 ANTAR domain-containing protein [Arthrobacter sp. 260]